MQSGVFEGDRRLVGHTAEQFQVGLHELLGAILRVQLNDAKRLPLGVAERHAHDRANAEIDNGLAELHAVVLRGVVAKEGLRGLQALPDDASAEASVTLVLLPPGLDNLGHQSSAPLLAEDDEATVGLAEQLEQAFYDLGQEGIELEGLAQVGADLEQAPQFLGRL